MRGTDTDKLHDMKMQACQHSRCHGHCFTAETNNQAQHCYDTITSTSDLSSILAVCIVAAIVFHVA